MMLLRKTALVFALCASIHVQAGNAGAKPLPYPEQDLSEQVAQLNVQIIGLEKQNRLLQQRIIDLEQSLSVLQRSGSADNKTVLQQAAEQFARNDFQAAAYTLNGTDTGGSGSKEELDALLLLQKSHYYLGDCQSVIRIGMHTSSRFAAAAVVPDALYLTGDCQWQIQQRDIAKNTWQTLIRRYPNTAAAKRAQARLTR